MTTPQRCERERKVRRSDYRVICECQRHARRERTLWRRSVRAVGEASKQVKSGGLALLIGVPLAFGAIGGIPGEAMSTASVTSAASAPAVRMDSLPFFTTERMRTVILQPETAPRTFTLDIAREQFFRVKVPYGSIIYREARKNRLAPELVAAVVEAESDFRHDLVSSKNAQGLMQIVPSTGRDLGADDLFNPEENIAAGTRYLRYLMDRFGTPRLALAAYNAGEGNIERYGGIPPFPETMNYLERVRHKSETYRAGVRRAYLATFRMRTAYSH